MNISKPNIALFYLALMVFFKVAGLHSLAPHGDDTDSQHCEVCHIATAIGFTPLLETDTVDFIQITYFFAEQESNALAPDLVFNNKYLSSYRFTRPPPLFS